MLDAPDVAREGGRLEVVAHDRLEVAVVDLDLLVGELLVGAEGAVELLVRQLVAERLHVLLEVVAAGELPEHELRALGDADLGRVHDLPGLAQLEDAVLVDAGAVAEGVLPDDRLVPLDGHAGELLDELAGSVDLLGVDVAVDVVEVVLARLDGHHDLLEGGVAGALADAVDGDLDLAGAVLDGGHRVGGAHAQVVLAVEAEACLVDVGHVLADLVEERAQLGGDGVADRVGDVDDLRPGIDAALDDGVDEVRVGAGGVHWAELHVARVARGVLHHRLGLGQHLLAVLAELMRHLDVAAVDEDVDAGILGFLDGVPGGVDIGLDGAGEGADGGAADLARDHLDSLEVAGRGAGEARLDDVDAELFELPGDLELLLGGEGDAGGLLAVSQGGIEDVDLFGHCGWLLRGDAQVPVAPGWARGIGLRDVRIDRGPSREGRGARLTRGCAPARPGRGRSPCGPRHVRTSSVKSRAETAQPQAAAARLDGRVG